MLNACLAFAAVAALVTLTPGLDVMLVLRTTVADGLRAGLLAGAGVVGGVLTWGLASAAGLTALLAASRFAFDVLRVAGACYLLWLGGRALWRVRRKAVGTALADVSAKVPAPSSGGRAALRAGLVTNLLNPKVGVFYMSLLPQFIPAGAPVLWTSLLFSAIHAAEGLLWLAVVALAAGTARTVLTRPAVRRRLEQVTGVVFIGFGVHLVTGR
ncbi:LysE family translocator [Actinomadura craniellae]|uniref:LysE family translocator n=1 Tax=Actinomadura craniellae TaxID=2231787 RepID=A0A365GXT2_9ACTN|nr:LysE family translocator [Actinomadura craniellae]RAY11639.1 LysE family translocator [Actinomadura craniellae]